MNTSVRRFTCHGLALLLALLVLPRPSQATIHNVSITNFDFTPPKTVVFAGDTVKWTLVSGFHTTTSDVTSPKTWNSPTLTTGQTYSVVFTALDGPGPFPYHCDIHLSMEDTIFMAAPPPTVYSLLLDESQANACAGTGSSATGWAVAVLSGDSTTLSVYCEHTVSGPTLAHIHLGAPCVEGAPQFTFTSPASPISQTWTLTPADLADLIAGNLYINIHSAAFPSGEIRGQIVQAPIKFAFTLDEAKANAGAGTGSFANGVGIVTLNAASTQLSSTVTHDVVSPTAAHIHLGVPAVEGPTQFTFPSAASPMSGTWNLDTLNLRDLFQGELYINVHTSANPGGEIRGQIVRSELVFPVLMDGPKANGGAGSGSLATGFCTGVLSPDLKTLTVYAEHNVSGANAAHLHLGSPSVEGPAQFTLNAASPISAIWNMTSADVDNLLAGLIYINVHSPSFPGGEIRGQFDHKATVNYTFPITQFQANLCAGTGSSAVGVGKLNVKPGGKEMTINITHTVASPTAGHIHLAPECADGLIQFSFGGTVTSPINRIWYLSSGDITNLFQKELYANVHSTTFPNEEIRGQIQKPTYICGNANGDGAVNVGDAVYLINRVFKGGPAPNPEASGDANCDGKVNVGDAVYLINRVFKGGPAPCAACS